MSRMPNTLYIAETDDSNAISTVWIKPRHRKTAKVFDPKRDRFDPNEPAEYSGASEAEIARWLVAQALADKGGPPHTP